MRTRPLCLLSLLWTFIQPGCTADPEAAHTEAANYKTSTTPADPGALIAVSMDSQVGVLLDEVPDAIRDRVAEAYLAKGADFWDQRARMQLEATLYRLTYRNFYYNNKGQLPMPPREQWQVTTGTPARVSVDGHDLVAVSYSFSSTLLTDVSSPAASDKALEKIGGTWDEPFTLPADPDLLFERTGYACMDEEDFPPNSVDSENALEFYDQDCKKGEGGCHVTSPAPDESCDAALKDYVGRISTEMHFERLAWEQALADSVRVGTANPDGADIQVVRAGLEHNRLIYRYVEPGSCAIEEGCVGGSGWRRLLQFDGSVKNLGSAPLYIGDVSAESDVVQHNMFEYSACHGHMHFSHYGRFSYDVEGVDLGSKRAFCLESTSRYANNETTPLTHPYGCYFQGIEAGWGDDYIAGIECQWIDVTPLDLSAGPITAPLTFEANPDGFLCEGVPVTTEDGAFTFEPTGFTTETGEPVDRIVCDTVPDASSNNIEHLDVTVPVEGSYVTEACERGQVGPLRNCGFQEQDDSLTCAPGEVVKLTCSVADGSTPQTLRVCETSKVLGTGLACTYREALFNVSVDENGANVTFTCPAARDDSEPGGGYAFYTTPTFDEDPRQTVQCVPR